MATKPFANAPHHSGAILSDYLLGIQAGDALDATGLPQMKYVKASELRAYMREGMASVYNYLGELSALPETAAVGDVFYAGTTFTEDDVTYTEGHLYAFTNDNTWDDITDLFSQYAKQSEVTAIEERLSTAESEIAAISGGITPKGDILSTNLPEASAENKGWQYYCTDLNKYAVSDGTDWVYFSNNLLADTPSTTDTSHALSNAAATTALNAEKAARENAEAALNARITNLEQTTKQDEITVNYPDIGGSYEPNLVPARSADYAEVNEAILSSRPWNQMIQDGNFPDDSTEWTGAGYYSTTRTISNNEMTLYGASGNVDVAQNLGTPLITGHKYLVCVTALRDVQGNVSVRFVGSGGNTTTSFTGVSSSYMLCAGIITSAYNESRLELFATGLTNTCKIKKFILRDLTLICQNDSSVPSTVAEAVKRLPDILKWDAYGYSLIDQTESGVESIGFNRYDGTNTMNKGLSNGVVVDNNQRWVTGLIPVNGAFTVNLGGSYAFFDINENLIGYENKSLSVFRNITPPVGTAYVLFDCHQSTVTPSQFMLALGTYTDTQMQTDHPYQKSTLSFPSSVTGKSAGSVHERYNLKTGKKTRPVGDSILKNLTWTYLSSYMLFVGEGITDGRFSRGGIWGTSDTVYTNAGYVSSQEMGEKTYQVLDDGRLWIKNSDYVSSQDPVTDFKASLEGKHLYYALATPLPDEQVCDPILNNFIKVEPNGTIEVAQTQTTKIDNGLSVNFDIIPA